MIRKLIAAACLATPLVCLAQTTPVTPAAGSTQGTTQMTEAEKKAAEKAKEAAKKAAEEAKKKQKVDEQKRVQTRGSKMGACLKQAADQKLQGHDKKLFLGKCMKA